MSFPQTSQPHVWFVDAVSSLHRIDATFVLCSPHVHHKPKRIPFSTPRARAVPAPDFMWQCRWSPHSTGGPSLQRCLTKTEPSASEHQSPKGLNLHHFLKKRRLSSKGSDYSRDASSLRTRSARAGRNVRMQRNADKLITLLTKVCRPVSRRLSVIEQGDLLVISFIHQFQTSGKIRVAAQKMSKSGFFWNDKESRFSLIVKL